RGPWRILITAVAALLLLASVVGAVAFVQHQQEGPSAQATPTSTQSVTVSPSALPGGLVACIGPLQVSDNASCIPLPPPRAQQSNSVLNSPAPRCDNSGASWSENTDTVHTCNGATSVTLKDTSQSTLACEVDFNVASSSAGSAGYASVMVTKGDGDPVV